MVDRFAASGMNVVIADVDEPAKDVAVARVASHLYALTTSTTGAA